MGGWVDRVLFSLSPDLSPSMSNNSSWSRWVSVLLVGGVGKGAEVWEEGWQTGPHSSLPKSVTLISEHIADDGDKRVAWVSCRLESSESTSEWSAEGTYRIREGFYLGIYTGIAEVPKRGVRKRGE